MDPLGRMSLTTAAYRAMTRRMRDLADDMCEGRLVIALEGGYSEIYAPYCRRGDCAKGSVRDSTASARSRSPMDRGPNRCRPVREIGLDAQTGARRRHRRPSAILEAVRPTVSPRCNAQTAHLGKARALPYTLCSVNGTPTARPIRPIRPVPDRALAHPVPCSASRPRTPDHPG